MVGFEEMKSSGREIRTFNLRSRLTARLKMLNPADRLTLVYLCFSAILIAVCRWNVSHWEVLLPAHFGLMAMIAGLAAARNRRTPLIETISH